MPIQIICKRGNATREAPPIQSNLINSVTMAKSIGKRFFDDPKQGSFYLTQYHKFTAPYKMGIAPGKFIKLTSERMALQNAEMKVKSVRIYPGEASIMCEIEAIQFINPEGG